LPNKCGEIENVPIVEKAVSIRTSKDYEVFTCERGPTVVGSRGWNSPLLLEFNEPAAIKFEQLINMLRMEDMLPILNEVQPKERGHFYGGRVRNPRVPQHYQE
jgi:hypothetical protein